MKQVGVDYTKASATALRRLAFFVSFAAVLYTILAAYAIFPASQLLTPLFAITFSLFWVIAATYYYFYPSETVAQRYARVIVYHILASTALVGVLGFGNPLSVLYVLLLVATYVYFGKRGFILSVVALLITGVTGVMTMLSFGHPLEYILPSYSIVFIAAVGLGIVMIGLMSTQETKRKTLLHSKRRIQVQQEQLVTIMNNLSDATVSINEAGTITMYNAACLGLLDVNVNLKGKKVTDVLRLVDINGESADIARLLKDAERTETRDNFFHQYTDGEKVRLEITYAPIRGSYSASKRQEKKNGYIIIMRDITKQKSLEEERDEFISVVSHELRTPITIAEGTLSNLAVLMERGLDTVDKKTLEGTVSTAHDQVLYLARMVNDLSTLSRAERGVADSAESIDVAVLMQGLYQKYQSQAAGQGLQLNIDLGTKLGSVFASKLYLEELLQNFITNAIKYTHEGSVTISAKRVKGSVVFTVKDTGIGMSRTDQAKVFQKFYRSEDYRIRETSGTGLGLYVASKLASKLGAKIELTSRVNFGSSFSFELPVEP